VSTAKITLLAHTGNTVTKIGSILVSITVIKLLVVVTVAAGYPGAGLAAPAPLQRVRSGMLSIT